MALPGDSADGELSLPGVGLPGEFLTSVVPIAHSQAQAPPALPEEFPLPRALPVSCGSKRAETMDLGGIPSSRSALAWPLRSMSTAVGADAQALRGMEKGATTSFCALPSPSAGTSSGTSSGFLRKVGKVSTTGSRSLGLHPFARKMLRANTVSVTGRVTMAGYNTKVMSSEQNLLQDSGERSRQLRRAHYAWGDWLYGTTEGQLVIMLVSGTLIVVVGALLWKTFCGESLSHYGHSWEQSFWFAWTMFFDPGTHTGLPGNESPAVKTVAVLCSAAGFIFNLSFLGMVVDLVRTRLSRWRTNRSRIVLTGHTVVLGWTDRTLFLLAELVDKASSLGVSRDIVVMAEREDIDMCQDIRSHFLQHAKLARAVRRVQVRKGCPYDVDDLVRVSAGSATEIVVLGSGHPRNADLEVTRITVALAAMPDELCGRVIAQVQRAECARVLSGLLPCAEGIFARVAMDRVLCLLALKPVVGFFFLSLLTSANEEHICAAKIPSLANKTFGEACRMFQRAVCLGIRPHKGDILFAPGDDYIIREQDKLIWVGPQEILSGMIISQAPEMTVADKMTVAMSPGLLADAASRHVADIASDIQSSAEKLGDAASSAAKAAASGATTALGQLFAAPPGALTQEEFQRINSGSRGASTTSTIHEDQPTHIIVVIGWESHLADILSVMDQLVPRDTEVHILSERCQKARNAALQCLTLDHLVLEHHVGERTSVHELARLPLAEAASILILSEGSQRLEAGGVEAFADADGASDDAITSDSAGLACLQIVSDLLQHAGGLQHAGLPADCVGLAAASCAPQTRIICEVLDPRTDRMLARNRALQQKAVFFRSGSLETGLFNIAASDPTSFNAFSLLLRDTVSSVTPSACEVVIVPALRYVRHDALDDLMTMTGTTSIGSCASTPSQQADLTPQRGMVSKVKTGVSGFLRAPAPQGAAKRIKSGITHAHQASKRMLGRASSHETVQGMSFWELHDRVRALDGGILIGWQTGGLARGAERTPLVPSVDRSQKLLWSEGHMLIVLRPNDAEDQDFSPGSLAEDVLEESLETPG